jgi:hypothetical protein
MGGAAARPTIDGLTARSTVDDTTAGPTTDGAPTRLATIDDAPTRIATKSATPPPRATANDDADQPTTTADDATIDVDDVDTPPTHRPLETSHLSRTNRQDNLNWHTCLARYDQEGCHVQLSQLRNKGYI